MEKNPQSSAATIREGLKIGLFVATCFSLFVVLGRLVLGPGAFQRFGISWVTIVAVYYATLSIGGLAFGGLSRYRLSPVGAMARGILFMLPGYLVFTTLIGFGTGKLPSSEVALWLALIIGVFAGSILGLWMWIDDTKSLRGRASERS